MDSKFEMPKDYITVIRKAVDDDVCQHIVQTFEDCQNKTLTNLENIRSFQEINITVQSEFKDIYPYLNDVYKKHIHVYKVVNEIHPRQFPEKYGFEELRIKKYEPIKDYFDYHVDVGDYLSARRFLVMMLYLNDVDYGGETEFPAYDRVIQPKAGTLVMFPATWTHLHKGHTPISGPKFIVNNYLHFL